MQRHYYAIVAISIHPPRAGRDQSESEGAVTEEISIHPPRAGRDKLEKAVSKL